jgi:hypothetical protein
MAQAKIIELTQISAGVLVTFSDGKVALLIPTVLYAFAVDPATLSLLAKADDDSVPIK